MTTSGGDEGAPPAAGRVLATRRFGPEDQQWFAALSGDHNPLHLDELHARRTMFGAPVVHGVHVLLWALESLAGETSEALRPGVAAIGVRFTLPVYVGEPVEVELLERTSSGVHLRVRREGADLLDIRVQLSDSATAPVVDPRAASSAAWPTEPRVLVASDLEGRRGEIPVPADDGALPTAFPALCASLGGPVALAEVVALTRLVGMECPGLHSIFSGLDIRLGPTGSEAGALRWSVSRLALPLSAARIDVEGAVVAGTLTALIRPQPRAQPRTSDVAGLLDADELRGERALVVGGSRGLGEVAAKLIAAAGGEVVLTWFRGEADAQRVVDDITAGGGRARSARLDAGDPRPTVEALAAERWVPTQLYYFATPLIFARRSREYDPQLFRSFADVYLTGFSALIDAWATVGSGPLSAFYPSSVAIDEPLPELVEYAAAKAAGEVAARLHAVRERWLEVVVERLPRVHTDQTASLTHVPAEDPAVVMAAAIRRVHAATTR